MFRTRRPGTASRIPKLVLRRETVVLLGTRQLGAVHGGEDYPGSWKPADCVPISQEADCSRTHDGPPA